MWPVVGCKCYTFAITCADILKWHICSAADRKSRDTWKAVPQQYIGNADSAECADSSSAGKNPPLPPEWRMWVTSQSVIPLKCWLINMRLQWCHVASQAFPVAAAQIWNFLPEHIVSAPTLQSFRRHLKTFYYNNLSAYSTLVDLVVISVT